MMNDETKERRCKFCGKLLISEKMPICKRCKLKARNKVGIVANMFTIFYGAKVFVGDKENGDFSAV